MRAIHLSAILCFLSLSVQGASILNTPPFHCDLSLSQGTSSPTELIFSVTNQLDEDLQLLSWYTPLEGLMSDLFIITNVAGDKLPYQGMMVKRGEPQDTDYITIPAGEKVEVVLELGDAYSFSSGEYQIKLKPRMWEYRISDKEFKGECGIETVTIRLE